MKLFLVFAFLLLPLGADAATRYASPSGSGSTCSSGTPCSLSTGLSQTSGGDTLLLKDGTFTSVALTNPLPSGTSSSVPTKLACENLRLCTLQITSGSGGSIIIFTAARSYITVSGINFDRSIGSGSNGACFWIANSIAVPGIVFEDNVCFASGNIRGGLFIGGGATGGLYRNNYIHTSGSHGFYIVGDSNIVEHNHIANLIPGDSGNNANCAQFYSSIAERPSSNIFRYNFCNTGNGSIRAGSDGLYIGTDPSNIAHNNIIINAEVGIYVRGNSTKIYNNAIYSVTSGMNVSAGSGCEIKNNALPSESLGTADADCTYSKNIATNGDISTSVTPTQLWISPTTSNFSLIESSAGIDTGTTVSISGVSLVGAGYDIGAIEAPIRSSAEVQDGSATIYRVTFALPIQSTRNSVGLQTCTYTNTDIFVGGGAAQENSCSTSASASRMDITLNAAVTNGQSLTDAYNRSTAPTLMDNVAIGDPNGTLNTHYFNAHVRSYTATSGSNNVGGGALPTFTQTRYRFHQVRGTEASPVLICVICTENVSISTPAGAAFRLRVKFKTDNDPAGTSFKLRYSKDSGSYTDIPDIMGADFISWYGNSGSTDIPAAGTATTELLTSDEATNVTCAVIRSSSDYPNLDFNNGETECEYVLQLSNSVTPLTTYDFRVYKSDNTALDTYSVTPRLTIGNYVFGL